MDQVGITGKIFVLGGLWAGFARSLSIRSPIRDGLVLG